MAGEGALCTKKHPRRGLGCWNRCLLLDLDDRNLLAVTAKALKADFAVGQCKEGIIAADAYIQAGMDLCATLPDEDVARQDELAVRTLRAEALRLAVAAVVGRTGALLMSEELKIHRKHLLASILLAVSE